MELATYNVAPICLAHALDRLHMLCQDVWHVPETDCMHDPEVPMYVNRATCNEGQGVGGMGVGVCV